MYLIEIRDKTKCIKHKKIKKNAKEGQGNQQNTALW